MSSYEQVKVDPGDGVNPSVPNNVYPPSYAPMTGYQTGPYHPTTTSNPMYIQEQEPEDDGDTKNKNSIKSDADDGDDSPMIPSKYLDLEFESCFREHKSTKTLGKVYMINGYIFKYTKMIFYNALVFIFGFLLSFVWGLILSIISFTVTWLWNPGLKSMLLVISATLPAVTEPLKALFTPLVDVQARVFRQIRVQAWLNGGLLSPITKREQHIA